MELASSDEGGQPWRRRREAGYGGPLDHTEGGGGRIRISLTYLKDAAASIRANKSDRLKDAAADMTARAPGGKVLINFGSRPGSEPSERGQIGGRGAHGAEQAPAAPGQKAARGRAELGGDGGAGGGRGALERHPPPHPGRKADRRRRWRGRGRLSGTPRPTLREQIAGGDGGAGGGRGRLSGTSRPTLGEKQIAW